MSGLHPKSIEILSQVAAHDAATLLQGGGLAALDDYKALQAVIYDHLAEVIEEKKGESTWSDSRTDPAPLEGSRGGRGPTTSDGPAGSTSGPDDGTAAVAAAFPGSTTVAPSPAPRPSGGKTQIKVFSRITVPGQTDERGGPLKVPNPPWLEPLALADGVFELWDNRNDSTAFGGQTPNPKRPWFKQKVEKGNEGSAKAYWPPKGSPEAEPSYVHPSFVNAAPAVDEEPF